MASRLALKMLPRPGPCPGSILRNSCSAGSRRYARNFSTGPRPSFRHTSQRCQQKERFGSRLGSALKNTKVQWYPIPIGLGIGFLGFVQFYKSQAREKERLEQEAEEFGKRPKKRPRIRPEGPWQVQVMSTLPLKAISRLWGQFNELVIPYYLRVPGFKLYAFVFGVNLDEVSEPDLHVYPNLAAFFYRTLKPGARPLDPTPNALLSPSDGRVLQYGRIEGGDIEQVKGVTYSVDALLGKNSPAPSIASGDQSTDSNESQVELERDEELVKQDEEFARVNGISYTLPNLLSGQSKKGNPGVQDQSTQSSESAVSKVGAELALGEKPWYDVLSSDKKTALYYTVIYLAPGDYHRFHSPGRLGCRTPPAFRCYVPVGATNVGSIKINFDRELRTNSLTTDTAADRAADEASARGEPYSGFAEATYAAASPVLGGHALRRGDEMGGFQLGSTVVLIFEAPHHEGSDSVPGFHWAVEKGQKVKMGQALGYVNEQS
ncbi:phosphatidylserine decarboxylase [Apiospora hydei]|uniref:Phosphatidylserine decarboxylase n=1 Tax=Apiospora hydei TaxID=1337664 RepID=A0ABR1V7C5_9PEZI